MLKILSEYNKYIMAGISMLLLVVFLAPTAVSRCSTAGATPGTVWATTSSGAKLTLGDLEKIRGQLQALASLRNACLSPQVRNYVMSNPALMWLVGTDPKEPEYWWLLAREAREAGLVGGQGDGRALVDGLAPLMGVPPEQLLAALGRESRQSPSNVLDALAELSGIGRMMELTAGAPRASQARLKAVARELMSSVSCEVVPLNAQLVGDIVAVDPPTPELLQKQFEAAREFAPGTGPLGAGYRVGDKVSIEWIAIPGVEIAKTVLKDPALGPVELRKEFLRNPTAYAAAVAPGAVPVAPDYETVKDQVKEAVRGRLNREQTERIAQFARDWARSTVKELPSNAGIVTLPADWKEKSPSLAVVSEAISNRFQLPLPRPGDSGPDLMPVELVDSNLFIGRASTNEFGQAFTVGQLVAQLHDLAPESALPIQAGVVGPVLTTVNGDLIIYRVREAVPSHAPTSIQEVQAAVLADVMASARYEALVKRAPEILAQAEKEGLASVANAYAAPLENLPQVSLANMMNLIRGLGVQPTALSQAGPDEAAVRAVIERALSLPTDPPISAQPDSARMMTVPVPSKLVLLVVRINGVTLPSQEDWTLVNSMGAFRRALAQTEPAPSLPDLFGIEAIKARHNFTLRDPDAPDRPMQSAPPPPAF